MAETPSTQTLAPGDRAPDFSLPDGEGDVYALDSIKGEYATVVIFACNHCPYVIHLAEGIANISHEYEEKGVGFAAISANDVENYPQDGPVEMVAFADASHWEFPYLYDESQDVAKAYHAACTPDFFVFDGDLNLTYAGQFDASRPKNGGEVTGADIRAALDATIAGESVPTPVVPSTGCNIKWKPGGEPSYFG
ncbi:thioredoxin family protein [Verrucomicrobiales bacterium]|nr:thioredoxin family protein [Verrucomicrobiales bacterium]